jgi:protein involved in polysaccharide export with SLBB domain
MPGGIVKPGSTRLRFRIGAVLTLAAFITGSSLLAQTPQPNMQESQQQSEQLDKLLNRYGYTIQDLQVLGIDPDNPGDAIRRARTLGIPESDIQQILREYRNREAGQRPAVADTLDTSVVALDTTRIGRVEMQRDSARTAEIKALEKQDKKEAPLEPRFEGLDYFGYELFSSSDGGFAAMSRGPADPGYIIGSGDMIRLYLWGDVEFQYELVVDNNGAINIPNVGLITVGGASLEELQSKLNTYLSRHYSGLSKSPPSTFLDVSVARMRASQVYLMGDVLKPASYAVPGYATVFNLMYTSGGPSRTGSMREIRIIRENKIVSTVDLYDYLALGKPTRDQRLRNGDILFVPPRQSTIAIRGEVKRPAVYEAKKGETVGDMIKISGGLKPSAYPLRVQIDRILPFEDRKPDRPDRTVLDLPLNDILNGKNDIAVVDGDVIEIFPFTDKLRDFVYITGGGITRPGRYQLEGLNKISDLIRKADGLTDDVYMGKANLTRTRKDRTTTQLSLNLEKILSNDPGYDLALMPEDSVRVYGREEWRKTPKVILQGFVKSPGEHAKPDSMTLFDLLFEYSGLQDSLRWNLTFVDRGDIYRLSDDGSMRRRIDFNLKDVWNGESPPHYLKDRDIVILYQRDLTRVFTRQVSLNGAVKKPGVYDLAENMTLADLIVQGGGFTENAWIMEAEISRVDLSGMPEGQLAKIIRIPLIDWGQSFDNPEELVPGIMRSETQAAEFLLAPYDQVRIRTNPDYELPGNVELIGEVTFPGEYTIRQEGELLSQLIRRAGGLKSTAHIEGGKLLRNERRLFLDFYALLNENDEREDVVLHPGDVVIIPPKPNSVTVLGEVINPGIYKFISGKRAKDYLKESGGFTRDGDRAFLTQPSGRTYEIGFMKNPKVKDGAILRVQSKPPEKDQPIDWTEVAKESMTVISSALTIIVLATRIN